MNYILAYSRLISRAQSRLPLDQYVERHHIVPRCMGGTDDLSNLVDLTPEEHYLAHQLLIRIYPKIHKLVKAAMMMSVSSSRVVRNNKTYGWIRRRYQEICKLRTGSNNSSFGRKWYHCPDTHKFGKFLEESIPKGWLPGRVHKIVEKPCDSCQSPTTIHSKFCDVCRRLERIRYETTRMANGYKGREQELISLYQSGHSIHSALKAMGYLKGNQGKLSAWAKNVVTDIKIIDQSSNGRTLPSEGNDVGSNPT